MSSPKATPMIKQYLSIKEKYKDSILFYRMGDFYEMFFEDAEKASSLLEITLTSRNKKDESSVPMCGIPVRAADNYIGRLIEHGCKVAVCEQIEDPATAKGLVKRDVVRVITPGMIIDNNLLDEKSNNYILAAFYHNGTVGLSFLDISTGEFRLFESDITNYVVEEALRISPSEIIFPESSGTDTFYEPLIQAFSEKSVTLLEDRVFNFSNCRKRLIEQFHTRSLEGFGCENAKAGVSAAGALLYYVRETQKQEVEHLNGIETYSLENYLRIDDQSCRNMELVSNIRTGSKKGSLIGVIDRTVTAMGGRLLKQWIRCPLIEEKKIQTRLNAVEEAKNKFQERADIRLRLKSVHDLERIGSKIVMGRSNARDMIALKNSLHTLPHIFSDLSSFETGHFAYTDNTDNPDGLENLHALAGLIENTIRNDAPPTINEGGMIKQGYNNELDELIMLNRDSKGWLARLEAEEKEKTGISTLKVRYNKVFGYYIEIPKSRSTDVPEHYIRKQTLVNAERYITDELKKHESKVLGAQDQRNTLEYKIFNEIKNQVIKNNREILSIARFISGLDCILSLAEVAEQNNYTKPEITTDGVILIEEGRHPVVEKMITGERYVPNTIHLNNTDNQVIIITGPNMAGKSTVLRQVALMVLMAQMGSFIPADRAIVSITDKIFTRVGALDNLSSGQSTFMVEMEETANIMNNATPDSLIIMDEIGRGTSTYDGLSIAWAVAEYLHDLEGIGVKTLFATHYHELTDLAETKSRVKNFNIAVKEWNDEIIFLRKFIEGSTNRSYGIQVARLAGLPESVVKRSKKVLAGIENGEHGWSITPSKTEGKQKKQIQLSLFRKPEQVVVEKLQKLDISTMMPIDALNILNELKEKVANVPF